MQAIFFYKTSEPYGEFSNFWPAAISIDGIEWPTSEHYYQAAKFFRTDPAWARTIQRTRRPFEAAQRGRSRAHLMEPGWEAIKEDVMRIALLAKFAQHVALRAVLLGTGERALVEHTRKDRYWGDGADGPRRGPGQNRLGHLLVELRGVFRRGDVDTCEAATRARLPATQPE